MHNDQFTKTIQEAVGGALFIPCDFHVALHMMALVYQFCYGTFLQVFQILINWKQISKDPSTWYKQSQLLFFPAHLYPMHATSFGRVQDLVSGTRGILAAQESGLAIYRQSKV